MAKYFTNSKVSKANLTTIFIAILILTCGLLSGQQRELVEKRTVNRNVYQKEDGSEEYRIYGSPINYQKEGGFEPIESELIPAQMQIGKDNRVVYMTKSNYYKVALAMDGNPASYMVWLRDINRMEFGIETIEINGNTVNLPKVMHLQKLNDYELQYTINDSL